MKNNAQRYAAIVRLHADSGIGAYRNALGRLVSELGDDAVQRLADEYEERRICVAEAYEAMREN